MGADRAGDPALPELGVRARHDGPPGAIGVARCATGFGGFVAPRRCRRRQQGGRLRGFSRDDESVNRLEHWIDGSDRVALDADRALTRRPDGGSPPDSGRRDGAIDVELSAGELLGGKLGACPGFEDRVRLGAERGTVDAHRDARLLGVGGAGETCPGEDDGQAHVRAHGPTLQARRPPRVSGSPRRKKERPAAQSPRLREPTRGNVVDRAENHMMLAASLASTAAASRAEGGTPRATADEVFALVYRQIRNLAGRRDVDELAQAAAEQVIRSLPSFQGRSQLATWTFRICYLTVRKHDRWYRRWLRRFTLTDDGEIPELATDTGHGEAAAVQRERLVRLQAGMQELSPKRRAVLVLHDIEELSVEEIAADRCKCDSGSRLTPDSATLERRSGKSSRRIRTSV